MSEAIADALKDAATDLGDSLGTDASKAVHDLYEDTGSKLEQVAERSAQADSENAGLFRDISHGSGDAEGSGLSGGGAGEDGAPLSSPGSRGGGGPGAGDDESALRQASTPGSQGGTPDPVDLVTGAMFLPQRDVELPGVLPLVLERWHRSDFAQGRWFGRTWASTLDQRVAVDAQGVHYAAPDGRVLHYPVTGDSRPVLPVQGARWPLVWDRGADEIRIEQPESGRVLRFPAGAAGDATGVRPLAAVTDRNGNRITVVRDAEGVPTDVYHSGGYHVRVESTETRDGTRVSALKLADPAGGHDTTVVAFGYDLAGRLTQTYNSSGRPLVFAYDDADRIIRWTDRNGFEYGYHYGEDGRVVRADGSGGFLDVALAYDLDARTTTMTDALGHATVHHWNERFQTVRVVDPLGHTKTTEQDAYGNVLTQVDELGRLTEVDRDEHTDPVSVLRPDGTTVRIAYDALRLPVAVTGPDGATWQYAYDERGNLTETRDPAGAATRYAYDDHGALVAVTDALGNATRLRVDAAGLPLEVTDAGGRPTRVDRDAFGRVLTVTDALGAVTRLAWTTEGRPASRTAPDGTREEWSYDAEGNLVEYRDAAGRVTAFEHGPFDMVVARSEPSGTTYRFDYDANLRLTGVTNAAGRAWRYTYDAVDNLVAETDFNGRALAYRHDAARQLVERINGAGEAVSFDRDPLGRVLTRTSGEHVERFGYDAAGRLARAEGPGAALAYTRDARGRVLTETVDGHTVASTYDALGRRVGRTTPTGAASRWTYDPTGLPTAMSTDAGGLSFGYDAAGRETLRYLGPRAALSQSFDTLGRLSRQRIWAYERPDAQGQAGTPDLVQQRTYAYRPDGLVGEITDLLRGTRHYDLDLGGRVTAVRADGWSETYAYDALGNLAAAATPVDDDRQGDRVHDGTLIRSAGRTAYEHDAQGRVVAMTRRTLSGQRRRWTYTWDADDRLVEARTPEGTWRYVYDPLGRRVAKQRLAEDGAVTAATRFAWDGTRLAEQVATGPDGRVEALTWDWAPGTYRATAQTRRSWAADAPQEHVDAAFHAIVTDLVGTPTELVTPEGRVAWHTTTSLWGRRIAAGEGDVDCPLRFPGQYHDEETGLAYNLHRYYDPDTAGFTSPDPLGLAPSPNHHAYVDNPLIASDPLGLAPYTPGSAGDPLALPPASREPPNLPGSPIVSREGRPGETFNMVLSEGQSPTRPGGFGTFGDVPNQDFVRRQLAIRTDWKPDVSLVQQYAFPDGDPIRIQESIIGPQDDPNIGHLPGGATQLEILNYADRARLIPIGSPQRIS